MSEPHRAQHSLQNTEPKIEGQASRQPPPSEQICASVGESGDSKLNGVGSSKEQAARSQL